MTASEMGKLSVIKRMGTDKEKRSEYMRKIRLQGIKNKERTAQVQDNI